MSQGVDGGYCDQYVEDYVSAWCENEEHQDFLRQNHIDLFKQFCRRTWGDKLSDTSDRQRSLDIDGKPAPVELRYRDTRPKEQRVKGGYITVLTECATVRQFFLAWQVVQANANKQVVAAQELYEMYEFLLDQADGDESAVIRDLI